MIVKKIYENSGDDSIVPIVKRGKIVDLVISNSNRSVCPPLYKVFKIFEYTASNGKKSYFAAFVPKNDEYNNDKSICMLFLGGNAFSSHVIYDVHNVYFNKDNDRLFVTRWAANDKLSMFMYNLCDLVLEEDYIVDTIDASNGIAICENSYAADVPIRFSYYSSKTDFKECVLLNGNTFKNKKVERIFAMNMISTDIAKCPILVQYKNGLFGVWCYNKWLSNITDAYYDDNRLVLINKDGKINVIQFYRDGFYDVISPIWCDGVLTSNNNYGFESIVKHNGDVDFKGAREFRFAVVERLYDKIKNEYKDIFEVIKYADYRLVMVFNDDKVIVYWFHGRRWIKKGEYDKIKSIKNVYCKDICGHYVFACKHDDKIDVFDLNSDNYVVKDFDGDVYSISDERGGCYLVTKEDNNDTYTVHFNNPIKNVTGAHNIYDTMFVLRNSDGEFTLSSFYNSKFIMWAKKLYGEYDKYPVFVIDDNGKNKILIGVKYNNGPFEEICFPYIRKKWLDEIIDIDYENQSVEGKIGDDIVRYSLVIN